MPVISGPNEQTDDRSEIKNEIKTWEHDPAIPYPRYAGAGHVEQPRQPGNGSRALFGVQVAKPASGRAQCVPKTKPRVAECRAKLLKGLEPALGIEPRTC